MGVIAADGVRCLSPGCKQGVGVYLTPISSSPGDNGGYDWSVGEFEAAGGLVIYEFLTTEEWGQAMQQNPEVKCCGSPGTVAALLGISRQAVYNAVHRGKLDMVRIRPETYSGVGILMITEQSVRRYVETAGSSGRRPDRQAQVRLLKDRFFGAR